MNLSFPGFDVLGENESRVLHRLELLADGASGRRIHGLAGIKTLRTTQQVLERFAQIGLITVRRLGNTNDYALNREHALWVPIQQILNTSASVERTIGSILTETFGDAVAAAAIYGSVARGEAGPDSDIDVLIVWVDDAGTDLQNEMLFEAGERIRRITGNHAQLLAVTETELRRLSDVGDPLVQSLRADARSLFGAGCVEHLLARSA